MNIQRKGYTPALCSLIFLWSSKAESLFAPFSLSSDDYKPVKKLTIFVDFLPAFQFVRYDPARKRDVHGDFVVPKPCKICLDGKYGGRWRKSSAYYEMLYIKHNMTPRHKRCYRLVKYFTEALISSLAPQNFSYKINKYHVKTAAIRHSMACIDTLSIDCAECVLKIFSELKHAYANQDLKALYYQTNLIKIFHLEPVCFFSSAIDKLCSVTENDTLETFMLKFSGIREPDKSDTDWCAIISALVFLLVVGLLFFWLVKTVIVMIFL